eukprot:1067767-Pyramimonas_sp.AAC.1
MLTANHLEESMISLDLGSHFGNSDGVMNQTDLEELERRKSAVKKALFDAMKASFGSLQEKLKEHGESLAEIRGSTAKKRRSTPPPSGDPTPPAPG